MKSLSYKLSVQLAVMFLFLVFATRGHAQSSFGSLVGNVSDTTGAAIPGADVTITNLATSEKRNAVSTASGDYQLLSLPPGQYSIAVSQKGFKRFLQSPIEVLVAQTTRLEVKLEIGQVTEQVEVTASAPIIQADNATLGQVVQGKAVEDMPLNGRNVLALVGLIPGVVMQGGGSGSTNGSNSGGNLTGQNIFAAGNFQISGGQANQSTTLVDGAPVNITYGHATILVPSQDSVQEFKVQTSSNTAEFGMYTGGVVNMATKSGSNAIHGTAFEFLRNTVLNATPWLSTNNPTNILAKPPYHQNQFGANVGFPIWKDHVFGFFDYQGYRQTTLSPTPYTVPTQLMRSGNFSELATQIYDPCPGAAPPNCPSTARTAFSGNVIPTSRINAVSQAMLNTIFPAPTLPGAISNNYKVNARSGGNNDQYTGRVDWTASDKQRVFARYTRWNSINIVDQPFHNGQLTPNPEKFTTNQIVLGDTYLFSQSLIGDLRISYLRYNYGRTPGTAGFDPTSVGLPAYYKQIGVLDGVPNNFPGLSFGGNISYSQIGEQAIYSINNNYVISPSISKTWKSHTIKGGADLRRLEWQFYQNNLSGGNFSFTNAFTAATATSNSGNPFASFLLGYPSAANIQISPKTFDTMYYQGYYVSDNWMVTRNLTATIGLRWEIPGVHIQRQNKIADFNPTEINPVLGSITSSFTGQPILGAFDLVQTSQLPIRGNHYEHFSNFSPRLGVAYRLGDKTVIRAGFGKFVVPNDVQFTDGSPWNPVNSYTNVAVASTNNNVTPNISLSNPFPNGFLAAPGRNSNYQSALLGNAINQAVIAQEENGLAYQWNVAVQRQMPGGIALEVAYAGSHGSHLPVSLGLNQVGESWMAKAAADPNCNNSALLVGAGLQNCFMTKSVTTNGAGNTLVNPFYGLVNQGTVAQLNLQPIAASNFYRPYPQYGSITVPSRFVGVSNYNGLQMKAEKRFSQGGVLLGSYSFSKFMGNAETLTSWLDTTSGYQDFYNLGKEYALSNNDARQQLVVSYVYALPFGRGQKWGAGVTGITDKLVSGWGLNGTTMFREGFPLGFTMSTNNLTTYAGQGTERPDVVAGCNKKISGPIQKRLGTTLGSAQPNFNTACFVAPGSTTTTQTNLFLYGNESRVDATLRAPGIANYDLALYKDTHLTERVAMQLRIESFNLFNRVQFGAPNTAVGNSLYGQITSVANQPRLLQVGGRINF